MGMLPKRIVVLIAADCEWQVVRRHGLYRSCELQDGPFSWFAANIPGVSVQTPIRFVRTGCGKICAAAATQYVISNWCPRLIVNLGTCGGFKDLTEKHEILIVKRTAIYDVHEIKGPRLERRAQHVTRLPLSWIGSPWPTAVRIANVVSGDQDLDPKLLPILTAKPFFAIAADWESGAIAHVAKRNHTRCLILRGVSDRVGRRPSTETRIREGTKTVMRTLLDALPLWLEHVSEVI